MSKVREKGRGLSLNLFLYSFSGRTIGIIVIVVSIPISIIQSIRGQGRPSRPFYVDIFLLDGLSLSIDGF